MDIVVLQLSSTGGARQKAADSFLAAFFICDPSKALEAYENSPVDYSSERRDGALAKMTKPLYYNIVTVFLSFRPHFD